MDDILRQRQSLAGENKMKYLKWLMLGWIICMTIAMIITTQWACQADDRLLDKDDVYIKGAK